MSHNFLTIHTLTALPLHNRNRDDRGQPKQLREGGAARGVLSSQSLKRAARVNYERSAGAIGHDLGSIRSKSIPEAAVERAIQIADERGLEFDAAEALTRATETVVLLTTNNAQKIVKAAEKATRDRAAHEKKAKADTDMAEYMAAYDAKVQEKVAAGADGLGKDTVVFVSAEEVEALALALVSTTDSITPDDVFAKTTGSLALAGFGRMTANAPGLKVEAGVAVSPAVTTHPIVINIDYFTAVDDRSVQGAAHLDQAFYTSGVYYRSATFDRRQLHANWSGWGSDISRPLLTEFVREVILSLPEGKKNGTAAAPFPSYIVAEEQRARTGYQFQTPVQPGADGGFLASSAKELFAQAADARLFSPRHFGTTTVSGTEMMREGAQEITDLPVADLDALVDAVVDWLEK